MAHHLKLDLIAVGVETISELNYLKQKKGLSFQGNYFASPEPFEQFLARIEKNDKSVNLHRGSLAS
jgi:EAL domain-containing protein (putative c-di-GMP-specific phosphodiesterase class I)